MATKLDLFIDSLTPDILAPSEYVNWAKIEQRIYDLRREIALLQSLDKERNPLGDLTDLLNKYPRILEVLRLLIAHTPEKIWFADGRSIAFRKDMSAMDESRAREIAQIFIDMKLLGFLKRIKSVEDCVKGVLIGLEPNVRKNRRGMKFETEINRLVEETVEEIKRETGLRLEIIRGLKLDLAKETKTVDFGINIGRKPKAVIEVNFYSTSGSKPSETLPRAYPEVQRGLADKNIGLIVISDGKGWLKMRGSISTMLEKLNYCFTLKQAKAGALKGALIEIIRRT